MGGKKGKIWYGNCQNGLQMHKDCFPPVNNEPMIIYLSWGVQNQDEHTLQCETYPNRSIISHIDPYAKMDTLERYVVPQHRALKKEFPMRREMQLSQQNDFSSLCFADEIPVFFPWDIILYS